MFVYRRVAHFCPTIPKGWSQEVWTINSMMVGGDAVDWELGHYDDIIIDIGFV